MSNTTEFLKKHLNPKHDFDFLAASDQYVPNDDMLKSALNKSNNCLKVAIRIPTKHLFRGAVIGGATGGLIGTCNFIATGAPIMPSISIGAAIGSTIDMFQFTLRSFKDDITDKMIKDLNASTAYIKELLFKDKPPGPNNDL